MNKLKISSTIAILALFLMACGDDEPIEYDEFGEEILTRGQLEDRGYTLVEFSQESISDDIVGTDAYAISADGGQFVINLLSAANLSSVTMTDQPMGFLKNEDGSPVVDDDGNFLMPDYNIYESQSFDDGEHGPWCKDYYVMAFRPNTADCFDAISVSHLKPCELAVTVQPNTTDGERFFYIVLRRYARYDLVLYGDVYSSEFTDIHQVKRYQVRSGRIKITQEARQ